MRTLSEGSFAGVVPAVLLTALLSAGVLAQGGDSEPDEVRDINAGLTSGSTGGNRAILDWTGDGKESIPHVWLSGGNAGNTRAIQYGGDRIYEPRSFVPVSRVLGLTDRGVFDGRRGASSDWSLWILPPGAVEPVRVVVQGSNPEQPVRVLSNIAKLANSIYFASEDALGIELWKADFATGTASLAKDLWQGGGGSSEPDHLIEAGERLFFAATVNGDRELWRYRPSGSPEYAKLETNDSGNGNPHDLLYEQGHGLFFVASNSDGNRVWLTDGESAPMMIPGAYSDPRLLVFSTRESASPVIAFEAAKNGGSVDQRYLWCSVLDGTPQAAVQLTPDPVAPTELTSFKKRLFFIANDAGGKRVLWISNGTEAKTREFWDLGDGPGGLELLVGTKNHLFLLSPHVLWAIHGGLSEIGVFEGVLDEPVPADHVLFFQETLNGRRHLWISQGVAEKTSRVLASDGSNPGEFAAVGNKLVFAADCTVDGNPAGREPWVTDGSTGGTVLLHDIAGNEASSNPRQFTATASSVFFVAETAGKVRQLWKTDGTPVNTQAILDIPNTPDPAGIRDLTVLDDRVFFAANDGSKVVLWWADESSGHGQLTYQSKPLSDPRGITAIDGQYLFFTAATGQEGERQIYASKGSTVVRLPRCIGSVTTEFALLPGTQRVIFGASHDLGVHGTEPHGISLSVVKAAIDAATRSPI